MSYGLAMDVDFCDPELETVFAAQVTRGEFANVEEARADFLTGLDEALAQVEAGETEDFDVVAARLTERYARWPRAAE